MSKRRSSLFNKDLTSSDITIIDLVEYPSEYFEKLNKEMEMWSNIKRELSAKYKNIASECLSKRELIQTPRLRPDTQDFDFYGYIDTMKNFSNKLKITKEYEKLSQERKKLICEQSRFLR